MDRRTGGASGFRSRRGVVGKSAAGPRRRCPRDRPWYVLRCQPACTARAGATTHERDWAVSGFWS